MNSNEIARLSGLKKKIATLESSKETASKSIYQDKWLIAAINLKLSADNNREKRMATKMVDQLEIGISNMQANLDRVNELVLEVKEEIKKLESKVL